MRDGRTVTNDENVPEGLLDNLRADAERRFEFPLRRFPPREFGRGAGFPGRGGGPRRRRVSAAFTVSRRVARVRRRRPERSRRPQSPAGASRQPRTHHRGQCTGRRSGRYRRGTSAFAHRPRARPDDGRRGRRHSGGWRRADCVRGLRPRAPSLEARARCDGATGPGRPPGTCTGTGGRRSGGRRQLVQSHGRRSWPREPTRSSHRIEPGANFWRTCRTS